MGASFANDKDNYSLNKAFHYLMLAMELRYAEYWKEDFFKPKNISKLLNPPPTHPDMRIHRIQSKRKCYRPYLPTKIGSKVKLSKIYKQYKWITIQCIWSRWRYANGYWPENVQTLHIRSCFGKHFRGRFFFVQSDPLINHFFVLAEELSAPITIDLIDVKVFGYMPLNYVKITWYVELPRRFVFFFFFVFFFQ